MFKNTSQLQSLGVYLLSGGKMEQGMHVILEKTLQVHEEAIVQDFNEKFTDYNNFTMNKLCENTADVKTAEGEVITKWPFSMMYVLKPIFTQCNNCNTEFARVQMTCFCENCRRELYG